MEPGWSDDPEHRLEGLAHVLIGFIYNTVEAARRSRIREAMLLVRRTSSGEDFKGQMLAYFSDGVASGRIDGLLDESVIDLYSWFELIAEFTPAYAGELRGQSQRKLDGADALHPGLLLLRGVTETMIEGHDSSVSWGHIARAVTEMTRVAPHMNVGGTFEKLFELSDRHSFPLGPALAHALLDRAESDPNLGWCRDLALTHVANAETDRRLTEVVAGVYETGRVISAIGSTLDCVLEQSNDPDVCDLLGLQEETIEPNG